MTAGGAAWIASHDWLPDHAAWIASHDWLPAPPGSGSVACLVGGAISMAAVTHLCSRCGNCRSGGYPPVHVLTLGAGDPAPGADHCGESVARQVMES